MRRHCACAALIAEKCAAVDGIGVLNRVCLNQVILTFGPGDDAATQQVTDLVNARGNFFLRTADWKGRRVLRVSVISNETDLKIAGELADAITAAWRDVQAD